MDYKDIKQKIKSGFKAIVLTYCILGNIYGVTEYLCGNTTVHVCSDIYLKKHEPTKLEKMIVESFNKSLNIDDKLNK